MKTDEEILMMKLKLGLGATWRQALASIGLVFVVMDARDGGMFHAWWWSVVIGAIISLSVGLIIGAGAMTAALRALKGSDG